jgi:hypothetical protein
VSIVQLYDHGKVNAILFKQFKIFEGYLLKICRFQHFVKNPILKVFLDIKVELKQTLEFILKQYRQALDLKLANQNANENIQLF